MLREALSESAPSRPSPAGPPSVHFSLIACNLETYWLEALAGPSTQSDGRSDSAHLQFKQSATHLAFK